MSRDRSEKRTLAFQLWKDSGGKKTLTEIANDINIALPTVSRWKKEDKWEDIFTRKKVQNGRGAPPGNTNNLKHGLYKKHIPLETLELMSYLESKDPIEVLRENINIQYAAIIRAQSIMYVASKDDLTKELKKTSSSENGYMEEFNIQFAWDKQGSFLNAQSKAITTLEKLITRYEELCGPKFEQEKLKVKKLKQEITYIKSKSKEGNPGTKDTIIKVTLPGDLNV